MLLTQIYCLLFHSLYLRVFVTIAFLFIISSLFFISASMLYDPKICREKEENANALFFYLLVDCSHTHRLL